jgi:reticulon-4-interacting protein 1, mitochondrial
MMFRPAAIGRILSGQERSRSLSTIASCRAVIVPRFGRPDVLEVRSDVSVPDLKPKEVLVRSRAVSINPLDLRVSFNPTSRFVSWFFLTSFVLLWLPFGLD